MVKTRVFLLKRRLKIVFRRLFRRRSSPASYHRLTDGAPFGKIRVKPISDLITKWTNRLGSKARSILAAKRRRTDCPDGYLRVGSDPNPHGSSVPKGYVAVYVGQKDVEGIERVLVPVVYINHPLFGDLLKESEDEFRFHYQGGITIPCRISEFERIRTRVKTVHECATRKLWRSDER